MKVTFETEVIVEKGQKTLKLTIEDNVLDVFIDDKKLFSADWNGNLEQIFISMASVRFLTN